jgi:hypothetical protein
MNTNRHEWNGLRRAASEQPPNSESGAFSANLVHSPDIRVHSCLFVVSVCMTPEECLLVVSSSGVFEFGALAVHRGWAAKRRREAREVVGDAQ